MSYYLAPSLVQLRSEVDALWPKRDKRSDGWIGDPSHAARKSDHNPDYDSGGVVRAIDIDKDGIDVQRVLDAVIGDSRVWYVIWNYHIYSRTYGWAKRRYYGSNPHDKHIHISLRHSGAAERDTSPWLGGKNIQNVEELQEEVLSWTEKIKNFKGQGGEEYTARNWVLRIFNSARRIDRQMDSVEKSLASLHRKADDLNDKVDQLLARGCKGN